MRLTKTKECVGAKSCSSKGADCAVLIVCAGAGERLGQRAGKTLAMLAGMPLFTWAVTTADVCASTAEIVVVVQDADFDDCVRILKHLDLITPVCVVRGGATRQESVACGLSAVSENVALVAVQDGARPLTPASVFELVAAHVRMNKTLAGAIAARPATDTLKIVKADGEIVATPSRAHFYYAETPQTFHRAALVRAHAQAEKEGYAATDDASLVEHYGGRVACVPIDVCNLKVTIPDDLIAAESMLITKTHREMRLGRDEDDPAPGKDEA